ncbi:hypothetical protein Barb6_03941 [Bacteroidales bacterium Barb6]|nr:hypothetical protein Barb6_03941 [Bacteroidales bacterium Barb6]
MNHFFDQLYDVNRMISFTEIQKINQRRIYKLSIQGNFDQITADLQLNTAQPDMILNSDANKRAYLVGAFLSGGSISSIDKSQYHLEIRSNKIPYLRLLQKLLGEFNITVTMLNRKRTSVIYIKKASEVSDFLKIIGANEGMLELEDKIIARDYINSRLRLNNLDMANLKKTSSAGSEQVKMIKAIRGSRIFQTQPDKFRFYCTLRLQHPELPLSGMVGIFKQKYQIKITRTGINHYALKIREIYKSLNN